MYSKAEELSDEFGHWSEHPKYPLSDWKTAIANDETRDGYWDWVANSAENDEWELGDAAG